MATLYAKIGVAFTIDDEELETVKKLINDGESDDARKILSKAMSGTYELFGSSVIPDDDSWTGGVKELADFEF